MSDEKVVIKIISVVECNADGADTPGIVVVDLTQKELDRLVLLTKTCKELDVASISDYGSYEWFPNRPAYNFEQLGDKYLVLADYAGDPFEFTEETEPDPDSNAFERTDTELMNVTDYGTYFVGYGKWSGSKFESIGIGLQLILEEVAKPDPTPREGYYFNKECDDAAPEFEDLPKFLNDECPGIQMYAREMMKRGEADENNS